MTRLPDFRGLLEALEGAGVRYVVVGGVAAIIEGAPLATLDLDIVVALDEDNLTNLLGLLRGLEARYRDPAGRSIEPTLERLRSQRIHLLDTRLGMLDVLRVIGDGWGYEEVARRSHPRSLGELTVAVLGLEAIVESKRAAGREKDLAALPLLERTLELAREESEDLSDR